MGSEACALSQGGHVSRILSFFEDILPLTTCFFPLGPKSIPAPVTMPPFFASEDLWIPVVRSPSKEPATTFLWPKHASQLHHRQHPALDDALKNTLEEKDREGLEVAATKSGKGVGKREIFITFDTFL